MKLSITNVVVVVRSLFIDTRGRHQRGSPLIKRLRSYQETTPMQTTSRVHRIAVEKHLYHMHLYVDILHAANMNYIRAANIKTDF